MPAVDFVQRGDCHMATVNRGIFASLIVAAAFAWSGATADERYPARPVRTAISFTAGGPSVIVARVMGANTSGLLGKQFVSENRTGAGGDHGAAYMAKA